MSENLKNYSQKEIDLALGYLNGNINDIQLNFISVQNELEAEKIKQIAKEINKFSILVKKIGILLLSVAIFFYFLLLITTIYNVI